MFKLMGRVLITMWCVGLLASCSGSSGWIDAEFARALEMEGYIIDAATVTPEDVDTLTKIDVSGSWDKCGKITSVKGIEYFVSLKSFFCNYNRIEKIDVSKNARLEVLHCMSNRLENLDVRSNSKLKTLDCSYNKIDSLDLNSNPELEWLYCIDNHLTQLDVSKNCKLRRLACGYNMLSELDVTCNKELTHLWCVNNRLTAIDIFNNRDLEVFECYGNPGKNGVFCVRSWFDNDSVPREFVHGEWHDYDGSTVKIDYYK